jgi:hypothetical protein
MSPLPSEWIESLFARMSVRYGAAWSRMYEGIDLASVKADWARELAPYANDPEPIKYALDNLPANWPPNVAQFKEICLNRPAEPFKRLEAPKADPARVAAEVAKIARPAGFQPLSWAYALQEKERQGGQLTETQRAAWRQALAEKPTTTAVMDQFTPIPTDVLPPGMRNQA